MEQRFCARCGTDVEDTGGFCLLGHSLRLQADLSSSLSELRAESDRAFEATAGHASELAEVQRPASEPVEPLGHAAELGEPHGHATELAAVPSSRPSTPPPPPPSRPAARGFDRLWEVASTGDSDRADPINAFAPPPRMDWGPQKTRRTRSLFGRVRSGATEASP